MGSTEQKDTYEALPGYFLQSEPSTNPSTFDYVHTYSNSPETPSHLTIPIDQRELRSNLSPIPWRNLIIPTNPMAILHDPPLPPHRHRPPRHYLQTHLPRPPRPRPPQRRRILLRDASLGRPLGGSRRQRHLLLGRCRTNDLGRAASPGRWNVL